VTVLVLALDTSTPATGVALCRVEAGQLTEVARRELVDPRRSGEMLAPLITEALNEAGCKTTDLGAIVVGVGPGPYTSLRVGIVTAAALGDALSIPVHGVCSLDGFVLTGEARITVATDARRREIYWARYEAGRRIDGPDVSAAQEVVSVLLPGERVIGAGAELYAAEFGAAFDPEGPRYPDPVGLIRSADLGSAAQPLVPLYLRRPDATPRATV
jgi:tRNA threonylcarbamoyl adenosine modification protein YeaZ